MGGQPAGPSGSNDGGSNAQSFTTSSRITPRFGDYNCRRRLTGPPWNSDVLFQGDGRRTRRLDHILLLPRPQQQRQATAWSESRLGDGVGLTGRGFMATGSRAALGVLLAGRRRFMRTAQVRSGSGRPWAAARLTMLRHGPRLLVSDARLASADGRHQRRSLGDTMEVLGAAVAREAPIFGGGRGLKARGQGASMEFSPWLMDYTDNWHRATLAR